MNIYGEYFYSNKISEYGLKNGYLDYATLAKAFDAVLNNDIMNKTYDIGYWDQESGFIDNSDAIEELQDQIEELENEQDELPEVFQWYIVSDKGARILEEINEIVYYNEALDMYIWGVTHWGTSWDYVITDVPCNTGATA